MKKQAAVDDSKARHAEFGVVDPLDESTETAGRGTRVTLKDSAGNKLADLIIGKEVAGKNGEHYVRLPDQKRVYRTKIDGEVSTKFADWIETDLLKAQSWDISKVTFDNYSVDEQAGRIVPGAKYVVTKDSAGKWSFEGLDATKEERHQRDLDRDEDRADRKAARDAQAAATKAQQDATALAKQQRQDTIDENARQGRLNKFRAETEKTRPALGNLQRLEALLAKPEYAKDIPGVGMTDSRVPRWAMSDDAFGAHAQRAVSRFLVRRYPPERIRPKAELREGRIQTVLQGREHCLLEKLPDRHSLLTGLCAHCTCSIYNS